MSKPTNEQKPSPSSVPATTEMSEKIILWQDHNHPHGYRPTLKMLTFPDGNHALELSVFGRVTVVPYTKPESPSPFDEIERLRKLADSQIAYATRLEHEVKRLEDALAMQGVDFGAKLADLERNRESLPSGSANEVWVIRRKEPMTFLDINEDGARYVTEGDPAATKFKSKAEAQRTIDQYKLRNLEPFPLTLTTDGETSDKRKDEVK